MTNAEKLDIGNMSLKNLIKLEKELLKELEKCGGLDFENDTLNCEFSYYIKLLNKKLKVTRTIKCWKYRFNKMNTLGKMTIPELINLQEKLISYLEKCGGIHEPTEEKLCEVNYFINLQNGGNDLFI